MSAERIVPERALNARPRCVRQNSERLPRIKRQLNAMCAFVRSHYRSASFAGCLPYMFAPCSPALSCRPITRRHGTGVHEAKSCAGFGVRRFFKTAHSLLTKSSASKTKPTMKPVTTDSVFPIASLSKPFVALGILALAEGNQLRFDDPVGLYLPTLPDDWRVIPLKRLIDHTSGVPDHYNATASGTSLIPAPISSDELIKRLTTLPPRSSDQGAQV